MPPDTTSNKPIRVLVVDDSPTARELLVGLLQNAKHFQVIGTASDGLQAVRLTKRMHPDVITMDVHMPNMSGLEATRQIMSEAPTPIVFVTTHTSRSDMDLTFEALQAGALTVVNKPGLADPVTCDKLVQTVRLMSEVRVVRRWKKKPTGEPIPPLDPTQLDRILPLDAPPPQPAKVIGIASSTGGPSALAKVLGPLPPDFALPILIVQHITKGFGAGFAEWLDTKTTLPVQLASHGDFPRPGTILLAPDDYHMLVNFQRQIELYKGMPYRGLRPSANYLFESMANVYGKQTVGIVLTGMGDDGAEGLEAMRRVGGLTIAQDEASCVVYGMPKEAIERGAAQRTLTLEQISLTLQYLTTQKVGGN